MKRIAALLFLLLGLTSAALAGGEGGTSAEKTVAEGTLIDGARIQAILQEFLAARKNLLPQARIGVRDLQAIRPFALPPGKVGTEVIPSDPQILGSRRFTILFRVDGQVVENLPVRAEVEALARVVVAAGDLGRGAILAARDLNVVEMDLTTLRNPCFDPGELVGRILKQAVRSGQPLNRTLVDFPPAVRRGEAVVIHLRQGPLRLTATGEAQQDGRAGETIRVRNSASRRDLLCRVLRTGQVEVEF